MHEFQEKRKFRRVLYSPLVLLILLILAILVGKGAFDMYHRYQTAEAARTVTAERWQDIADREAFLEASIGNLKTSEGVEKALREKFNVHKAGESVVLLVSEEGVEDASEPSSFGKVKRWFEDLF